MLRELSDRGVGAKKIAIATCCDAFTDFLSSLLRHWNFEVCAAGSPDVLLLAEEGCAEPDTGQRAVWLTRSKYQGTDRLSLPLSVEKFWQVLEHRYHKPPRMHIRMDVEIVASVVVDDETVPVTLSSLSDMGCRFSYYREMVRDQQVFLSLPLGGEELIIDSRVIYAHHLSAANDNNVRVGLLFRGIQEDQRDKLRAYLILQFLEKVQKEIDPEHFRKALEYFDLPTLVSSKLGI